MGRPRGEGAQALRAEGAELSGAEKASRVGRMMARLEPGAGQQGLG